MDVCVWSELNSVHQGDPRSRASRTLNLRCSNDSHLSLFNCSQCENFPPSVLPLHPEISMRIIPLSRPHGGSVSIELLVYNPG